MPSRFIALVTVIASCALLFVSLAGIATDPYATYKSARRLQSPEILYRSLDQSFARNGLSDAFLSDFIIEYRKTINYDWPDDADYMPPTENWILFTLSVFDPMIGRYLRKSSDSKLFSKVELPRYQDALKRGFGICSQLALAGADLLNKRYGVDSRVAGLNGHVTVQVFGADGTSWVVDPSYETFSKGNVLNPNSLPDEFYKGSDKLKNFYGRREVNFISSTPGWGGYSMRTHNKQNIVFSFVILSYWLKWIIPLFGIGLGLSHLVKRRN